MNATAIDAEIAHQENSSLDILTQSENENNPYTNNWNCFEKYYDLLERYTYLCFKKNL